MDLFQIYLTCFGVGFVFAIVSAFLADVFGGHDAHLHGGDAHPHVESGGGHEGPGFAPVSPTTLATFVTAFGGFGLIFSKVPLTSSPWISVPLAMVGGFIIAAIVFTIFSKIFHATQSSSEGRVGQLLGCSATVITPIPPGGVGEIAYVQGGTRYTAPARSEDSMTLTTGTPVWIVRIAGAHFYVNTG